MTLGVRSLPWILAGAGLASVSVLGAALAFDSLPQTFRAADSGDTYLSSSAPATPHGTATVVWVSRSGGSQNSTLIEFDISGKLRPGDLVVQARISLTISDSNSTRWPVVITTGRILTAWKENSTTFSMAPLLAFDTSTATSVGVNGPPPSGSTVSIDATKQLHRWQSYGGPSNFGTVITISPGVTGASIGFASRENVHLSRPFLEVTFQPGPRGVYGYQIDPSGLIVATRVE